MTVQKLPWLDYRGKFSALKAAVFAALFIPGLWTALAYQENALGARPLTEAIHQFGLWTIRLLFISLAVTPIRQVLQWPSLLLVRRMIGVAACVYGLIHLSLYAADEVFDLAKVGSEIVLRIYLTIGFTALLGLATLAATSTDGMVRRLGARRWQKLHRIAYGIALLAVIHFCMQSKLFLWEPMVMAGIYAWLMLYRLTAWASASKARLPLWAVAALSLVAGIGTALGEAFYYWLSMGAPIWRVLMVDLTLDTGLRPGWVVLASTGAVVLLGAGRALLWPPRKARLRAA